MDVPYPHHAVVGGHGHEVEGKDKLQLFNLVSITATRMNNSVAAIAGKAKACVTASAAGREAGLSAEKIEVSGYVVP